MFTFKKARHQQYILLFVQRLYFKHTELLNIYEMGLRINESPFYAHIRRDNRGEIQTVDMQVLPAIIRRCSNYLEY